MFRRVRPQRWPKTDDRPTGIPWPSVIGHSLFDQRNRRELDDSLPTVGGDRLVPLMTRVLNVPDGISVRATKALLASLGHLMRGVWGSWILAGVARSLPRVDEGP